MASAGEGEGEHESTHTALEAELALELRQEKKRADALAKQITDLEIKLEKMAAAAKNVKGILAPL